MRRIYFDLLMGEEIVYETGIHFIIIFQFLIVGIFFGLLIAYMFWMDSISLFPTISSNDGLLYIILILPIVLLLLSFIPYAEWKRSYVVVTNQRILFRTGLIRQNMGEIILKKLSGITIEQDIIGRLINYGTIKFNGDNDVLQPLRIIANPLKLKHQVMRQIHKEDQV